MRKKLEDINKKHSTYKGKGQYTCLYCGGVFVSYSKQAYNKYCSFDCFKKHKKSKEKKNCLFCGKEFENYPKVKHCSRECSFKTRAKKSKKKTICVICKREFEQNKSSNRVVCSRECFGKLRSKLTKGTNNPKWSGGVYKEKSGYIRLYKPEHPNAIGGKWIYQHRLVVEKHIGRYLKTDEIIHHIDGNPTNNSIENLQITTRKEHRKLHKKS